MYAPAPLLVHCAAGKDRTGIAVAVLLAAGIPRPVILRDYRRSSANLPALARRLRHTTGTDTGMPQHLAGVSEPALSAILDHLDLDPAGALHSRGVSAADLQRWQARVRIAAEPAT